MNVLMIRLNSTQLNYQLSWVESGRALWSQLQSSYTMLIVSSVIAPSTDYNYTYQPVCQQFLQHGIVTGIILHEFVFFFLARPSLILSVSTHGGITRLMNWHVDSIYTGEPMLVQIWSDHSDVIPSLTMISSKSVVSMEYLARKPDWNVPCWTNLT